MTHQGNSSSPYWLMNKNQEDKEEEATKLLLSEDIEANDESECTISTSKQKQQHSKNKSNNNNKGKKKLERLQRKKKQHVVNKNNDDNDRNIYATNGAVVLGITAGILSAVIQIGVVIAMMVLYSTDDNDGDGSKNNSNDSKGGIIERRPLDGNLDYFFYGGLCFLFSACSFILAMGWAFLLWKVYVNSSKSNNTRNDNDNGVWDNKTLLLVLAGIGQMLIQFGLVIYPWMNFLPLLFWNILDNTTFLIIVNVFAACTVCVLCKFIIDRRE